jgi:hypothetical protein
LRPGFLKGRGNVALLGAQASGRHRRPSGGLATDSMVTPAAKSPYAGYRFPVEVISHANWLYFRFPHSLRDLLLAAGIDMRGPSWPKPEMRSTSFQP